MLLESITQLEKRPEQAIIINVGTKEVSTLALVSALRYAAMPILLIDCESDDGSFQHFNELQSQLNFDLLAAPLRRHSGALDWIFSEIRSEKVLLIDSDIEILNDDIFVFMRRFIDGENVFGCGLIEGPNWMSGQQGFMRHGLFEERMWIPLTMLKVSIDPCCARRREIFRRTAGLQRLFAFAIRFACDGFNSLSHPGTSVETVSSARRVQRESSRIEALARLV